MAQFALTSLGRHIFGAAGVLQGSIEASAHREYNFGMPFLGEMRPDFGVWKTELARAANRPWTGEPS
ncbi:hypothetical protein GCM10009606_30420 [Nocardioides aquiterrae]|uniref:Uncharacterized protein n=1 Tax=Nocardioides aquiterrae TaxID=203799 RepID=A0ABN1UGL0_9ACTN